MTDSSDELREYVKLSWKVRSESVLQSQTQLLNWLFALQGAGIAGCLGYATSKGVTCGITLALGCFCLGLVLLLCFGAFMYYFEERRFASFRSGVSALESQAVTPSEFIQAQNKYPAKYKTCEFLAWGSGVLGLAGIGFLIFVVV